MPQMRNDDGSDAKMFFLTVLNFLRKATPATGSRKAWPVGADWLALSKTDSPSDTLTVYDLQGQPLRLLSQEKVASGGGGSIYRFAQNKNVLIKVCKDSLLNRFGERVQAMLALQDLVQKPYLAWPLMPVFDNQGKTIGFAMRKCAGRTFRALYAPCQVKRFFPGWNRLQVTEVALNLVNGVQELARQNVLVCDFNPDNFLVDRYGRVQFIDCDSFQIPALEAGNTPHLSKNFMPEYAAPELLFHPEQFGTTRTPEQTRFSLAIVVFMIILSGLHPFSRCGGSDPVTNLKSGRCPLNPASKDRVPVGWSKSISWLPDSLHDLFKRMFVDGYNHPDARPKLSKLKQELIQFIAGMRQCRDPNQLAIMPKKARRRSK